jgi:5'-deoxynucleotidase YfbR-like HD superfamily hydrolase
MKPFIETYTGHTFAPLDPVWGDIEIRDIAHALANQCRFSGHTRFRYSVAEHSLRVSELLQAWGCAGTVQLWGLLHDASEAYLIDLPSPLKIDPAIGVAYQAAEAKLMRAICRRYSLDTNEPQPVKSADMVLLATEARDLMHGDRPYWKKINAAPLDERIRPWAPDVAEHEFLRRYRELSGDKR